MYQVSRSDTDTSTSDQKTGWLSDLRLLVTIAVANVAAMVAQTAISFVDFWVVSQLDQPTEAQAAVSSASVIFILIFAWPLGVMVCTTTVASQSFGAKRMRDCSAYAWQGIWMSLVIGAAAMALWPVIPQIFAAFGHEPAVQAMEVSYTRIRLLSVGMAGATVAIGHYFLGIHRPWPNSNSTIVAIVVNVILSYGLVLGKWGMPAMGVDGAAWGSVIATAIRLVYLMVNMCYAPSADLFSARQTYGWDTEKARRLLKVGWASGMAFMADVGAWSIFMVGIIGLFGTDHLAATATVWRYVELSFMPAVGIGLAVSSIVGKAIGEKQPDVANRRALIGTGLNIVYMGIMGVLYLSFGRQLMMVFTDVDSVIRIGIELLVFCAIFQLFDAVGITYINALRGAGDTRWPGIVQAIQGWVIMVGCGYLIAKRWPELGSKGPWFFATMYVIAISVTFYVRWRRGKWRSLDVIGPDESPLAGSAIGDPLATSSGWEYEHEYAAPEPSNQPDSRRIGTSTESA
jgi:MATE family multidrug resistance protein